MPPPDERDDENEPIRGAADHHDRIVLITERLRDVRQRLARAEQTLAAHDKELETNRWQISALTERLRSQSNGAKAGPAVPGETNSLPQFLRAIIFGLLGIIGTLATGKALNVAGLFQ